MAASILVLEDDEAMGRFICRRLAAAGHRVRAFAHAAPALDEIDGGATFDLYLLDVTMSAGELHGLALARMIKTRFHDARIIFVTGDPDLVSGPDKKLGPVVPKPIDFSRLLHEIGRLLASGS
jgi:two-component system, cell cycle response regulator CpdR